MSGIGGSDSKRSGISRRTYVSNFASALGCTYELMMSKNRTAMRKRKAEAEHAARLVQECEAMETEIAMLKNKRSPTEVSSREQSDLCRMLIM